MSRKHEKGLLDVLDQQLQDQDAFGRTIRTLLTNMDLLDEELDGDEKNSADAEEERQQQAGDNEQQEEAPEDRSEADQDGDGEAQQGEGQTVRTNPLQDLPDSRCPWQGNGRRDAIARRPATAKCQRF